MKTHTHVKDIYRLEEVVNRQEKDHEFKILLDKARLRVAIARQIKIAREEAELSQSELAEALGMSQPMIGRLEGLTDSRLPSIELLAKIASITKKKLVVNQPGFHLELACTQG